MKPRLMRSESERMIAGVCSGIGQYLGLDPVLVRLAFLLLIPAGSIGIPLYFILMLIMPNESDVNLRQSEIVNKNIDELGSTLSSTVGYGQHPQGLLIAASLLIFLGAYFLLENIGLVNGRMLWPLVLILLGLVLLARREE